MTLYSLIKTIKGIANIQPNISFVHSGDVYELNKRADIDYPAFVISQNIHHNNTIDDEELYGLTLFAIDRLTSDTDNQLDIQSWANELLKGIIVQIEELDLGTIIGDVVVQPFTEKFESLCAGCYAQIQVRINNIDCESDLWLIKLLEKIKNVIKFKEIEELEGVDPDTLLWYVGDKPIHIIDVKWTLDEDGALMGIDGKYYERWVDTIHGLEKRGDELHYDYVKSDEYIIPREGYVQYKEYKTYYSPNGEHSFKTNEFIYGTEEEIQYTLDEDGYLIGVDGKYYERWYNDEYGVEKQGAELPYEYIKSDEFIVPRPGYIQYKEYKEYTLPNNITKIKTDEYIYGPEEEIPLTLDEDGAYIGDDYKLYERWYNDEFEYEKQGAELRYEYIESTDFIIPRDGYIQYKWYKTYYSPNNKNSFPTADYILGEEQKTEGEWILDVDGYIIGEDGIYYERWVDTIHGEERQGSELLSDYVKSDEYEIDGDEVRYKYYLTYYTPNNTPIKTDEFVMGEAEEIQYTLDANGYIVGDDGKYYERWYNTTFSLEKQGNILRNEYIKSDEYIVPREGYIQYKYYLTYYKPNGTAINTDEYILGEEIKVDDTDNYTLRFTSLDDESNSLSFNDISSGVSFEVSKDMVNWETVTKSTVYFYFNKGETIYVRGNNPNGISNAAYQTNILITKRAVVSGDIMSLIYPTEEQNTKVMPCPYCFASLFENRIYLEFDDNFKLSATTLTDHCYEKTFAYCYAMTKAPELPATTLANYCYKSMFLNCLGLTKAPTILPATTLANYCYESMFSGCNSLEIAPELPATTLANGCYNKMFSACTKLNEVKCNARYNNDGTELTYSIGYNWLATASSTGTFYKNPDWAGPTTRSGDSIPSDWTILDWE